MRSSITSLLLLTALASAEPQIQGSFVAGSFDITLPKGVPVAKWTPWWKRPRPTAWPSGWPKPTKKGPTETVETLPWPPLPTSVVAPPVTTRAPISGPPAVSSAPATSVASGGHNHGPQPTGPGKPKPTWPAGDGPVPPGFAYEPRLSEKTILTPGARIVTKRSGPYRVKPGEMFSTFDPTIELPCTNCWITAGEGRIEYEDGTEANIDTGAYLHHMVVASLGGSGGGPPAGVVTGGNSTGGPPPGVVTGGGGGGFGGPPSLSCNPDAMQDVKAGLGFGNERTVTRFNGDGRLKFGSPVREGDRFSLILDLMNDAKEEKILYARVVYEIVEGEHAKDFVQSKSFKLDVGECTTSEVPAQESGKYSLKSKTFTSKIAGTLLYTTGHMHDGGVNTTVFVNDKPVCASEMLYDRRAGWREPEWTGHVAPHISDAGVCRNFGRLEVGDKVHIEVHYDADKYPPTQHSADSHDLHPVMGVAFVFVGPDKEFSGPISAIIGAPKPTAAPPLLPSSAAPPKPTTPAGDGHDHEHSSARNPVTTAPVPTRSPVVVPEPNLPAPSGTRKSEVFPVWTTLSPIPAASTAAPPKQTTTTAAIVVIPPSSFVVPTPTVTPGNGGDGHDHDHGSGGEAGGDGEIRWADWP